MKAIMNNKKPATIMKHYRKNAHYKDAGCCENRNSERN